MQELEQAMQLHRTGKLPEAESIYKNILRKQPDHGDTLRLLALIYTQQNQDQAAEQLLLHALTKIPNFIDAWIDLGNIYLKRKDFPASLNSFDHAIKLDQNNAMAYYNKGFLYHQQENYPSAITYYEQALALRPHYIEAYNNLGNAYQKMGETPRALSYYLQALTLNPADLFTQYNLARCYQLLDKFSEAVALYEKLIKQQPLFLLAYINLAAIYETLQQAPEALTYLRVAQKIQPDHVAVLSKLALAQLNVCDWENIDSLLNFREQWVANQQNQGDISPFGFMVHCDSPSLQQQCAMQWSQQHYSHLTKQNNLRTWSFARGQKLKIGYLSADFHHHPSAFIAAELFELHHRDKIEVHAYSYGHDDQSDIRKRIIAAVDSFNDLQALSLYECAEKIYRDNINILIDFTGLSNRSTLEILALRPAPIQIHYLGYPGTLGTHFIDYYISDDYLIPPQQEHFYCEKILRLPYRIDDRKRLVVKKQFTRAECGLPEHAIILCCHTVARKILPSHFKVWCDILHATPNTVLWLYEDNILAKKNLIQCALQQGITAERFIFAPRISYEAYLARLSVADLFLDTFPYNAHSTAHDALWAGVPLVTLCGNTLVSRVGATLLKSMNLENLITYTREQYAHKVIELSNDTQQRKEISQYLLTHQTTFPLFDSVKATFHIEQLYDQVWQNYLSSSR